MCISSRFELGVEPRGAATIAASSERSAALLARSANAKSSTSINTCSAISFADLRRDDRPRCGRTRGGDAEVDDSSSSDESDAGIACASCASSDELRRSIERKGGGEGEEEGEEEEAEEEKEEEERGKRAPTVGEGSTDADEGEGEGVEKSREGVSSCAIFDEVEGGGGGEVVEVGEIVVGGGGDAFGDVAGISTDLSRTNTWLVRGDLIGGSCVEAWMVECKEDKLLSVKTEVGLVLVVVVAVEAPPLVEDHHATRIPGGR